MNSFQNRLLLPIRYGKGQKVRNYAVSSTIQKDTMWCGDVIYDLGVNSIGQSEFTSGASASTAVVTLSQL